LKIWESIFPNKWFKNNINIKIIDECERIFNKRISVETILQNYIKIGLISNIILDEEQIDEIKNKKKIVLKINKKKNII